MQHLRCCYTWCCEGPSSRVLFPDFGINSCSSRIRYDLLPVIGQWHNLQTSNGPRFPGILRVGSYGLCRLAFGTVFILIFNWSYCVRTHFRYPPIPQGTPWLSLNFYQHSMPLAVIRVCTIHHFYLLGILIQWLLITT